MSENLTPSLVLFRTPCAWLRFGYLSYQSGSSVISPSISDHLRHPRSQAPIPAVADTTAFHSSQLSPVTSASSKHQAGGYEGIKCGSLHFDRKRAMRSRVGYGVLRLTIRCISR